MSGPLGVSDYEPRSLRVPGFPIVPIVGGAANLYSRPVPPGATWRVNAIIVVVDGIATATAAGAAAASVMAGGAVGTPAAGAAIVTLAGLTIGASYQLNISSYITASTVTDLQLKNGAAVVGSIATSNNGPVTLVVPLIIPSTGTLSINAIAGAAQTYMADIVATLIPSPAVPAASGTAIIYTGAAGDWAQALFTVPIVGGIGYWEPRRLVLGDGAQITAALSGVTVAQNARLDLLVEPIDYLPERTPIEHTPLVIDAGEKWQQGDGLHGYDPTMQEVD